MSHRPLLYATVVQSSDMSVCLDCGIVLITIIGNGTDK